MGMLAASMDDESAENRAPVAGQRRTPPSGSRSSKKDKKDKGNCKQQ